jgi:hypothetical protein
MAFTASVETPAKHFPGWRKFEIIAKLLKFLKKISMRSGDLPVARAYFGVHVRFFQVCLLTICLTPLPSLANTISIASAPGSFQAKTLGQPKSVQHLEATFQLTEFRGTSAWPAGAYIGFHEGVNRDNSFQFMLMRNTQSDAQLAVGYRLVKDGKEQSSQFIQWVPLDAQVHLKLSIKQGLVTMQVGNAAPVKIPTALKSVSPYTSVSSGTATFDVSP